MVRRLLPGGRKGSMANSTATCSTWRGMPGSLPLSHHEMATNNQIILARSPPGSTRTAPSAAHQDGGVKYATGASSKIRGRDNITIGTWNTRTLTAAGKLKKLTHGMVRSEKKPTLKFFCQIRKHANYLLNLCKSEN